MASEIRWLRVLAQASLECRAAYSADGSPALDANGRHVIVAPRGELDQAVRAALEPACLAYGEDPEAAAAVLPRLVAHCRAHQPAALGMAEARGRKARLPLTPWNAAMRAAKEGTP